ncbi:MAG: arylsulfatase A, partial [Rhodothermales bacterium]
RPPNIIVIMVDDMGYEGVSCFGNTFFKTPHIDQLAADGMKFTDFHANGSVCSPTRAALMTGRYQHRAGIPGVINADPKHPDHVRGIADEHWTFAEAMKSAGYATGIFGKWHLGYRPECNPSLHGFDTFIGFISGNIDFHSHYDRMVTFDWWHNTTLNQEKGFQTDLSSDDAVEFITANKDKPFFVYVPYGAPHSPNQGRASKIMRGPDKGKVPAYAPKEELNGKPGDDNWVIRHMITAVDDGVGKIRAQVETLGLANETIIWFCSDNGGTGSNKTTGARVRAGKGSVFEGGHRVPAIAWAPDRIKPGTISDETIMIMDLMPTCMTLAAVKAPADHALDGVDLGPVLFQNAALPKRMLFWATGGQNWAARDGNWKYTHTSGGGLYKLDDDLTETNDLSAKYPERVKALTAAASKWYAEVSPGDVLKTAPLAAAKPKAKKTKRTPKKK